MLEDMTNQNDPTEQCEQDDQAHRLTVFPSGASVSYQEGEVVALAAALATLEVRPLERVLIVLPDDAGFVEAVIATIRQAAVPLPVNPSASAEDLAAVVADTGARLMVVADGSPVLDYLWAERTVPVAGRGGTWATVLLLG